MIEIPNRYVAGAMVHGKGSPFSDCAVGTAKKYRYP